MGHVPTARRPSGLQAALAVQSECATLLTVRQPRREQQASPAQLCQRQTPPMPGVVRLLKTESTQAPETKRSPPRPGLHSPRPGASLKAAPPPPTEKTHWLRKGRLNSVKDNGPDRSPRQLPTREALCTATQSVRSPQPCMAGCPGGCTPHCPPPTCRATEGSQHRAPSNAWGCWPSPAAHSPLQLKSRCFCTRETETFDKQF